MSVSRFGRHLGEGKEIEINGEKFLFKPLSVEYLPDFFKIMKAFSGASDESMEGLLRNLDDDGLNSMKRIVLRTMEISYPEEWSHPESRKEMESFALKYMAQLFEVIFELNSSVPDDGKLKRRKDFVSKMKGNAISSDKDKK